MVLELLMAWLVLRYVVTRNESTGLKLAHDLHIIKLDVVFLNVIHHEDVDLHHVGTETNKL